MPGLSVRHSLQFSERARADDGQRYRAVRAAAAEGAVTPTGPYCRFLCELACNNAGGDPLGCSTVCRRACRGLPVTETAFE